MGLVCVGPLLMQALRRVSRTQIASEGLKGRVFEVSLADLQKVRRQHLLRR